MVWLNTLACLVILIYCIATLRLRIVACNVSVFIIFSKCSFCDTLRLRIVACNVVAAALFNCSKCLSLRT